MIKHKQTIVDQESGEKYQHDGVFEDSKMGIKGMHTLSTCSIRDPRARVLAGEIWSFSRDAENKIKLILEEILEQKLSLLKMENERVRDYLTWLREEKSKLSDMKHATLTTMYAELRAISLVNMVTVPNIIPTAGRSVLARWIIGDNTYSGDTGANYGSLGTSSTAVANGDTQLGTEVYRKATSSTARSSNVATLSNFYTATETTGTYQEAGWHIDGTASANTGQLLSHFLTGAVTKSSTETLVVESTLTIS